MSTRAVSPWFSGFLGLGFALLGVSHVASGSPWIGAGFVAVGALWLARAARDDRTARPGPDPREG